MQRNLLVLRETEGYTRSQLAKLLGISLKTYSQKERGISEFTQDEMFTLSCFFGKNIDQIFLPRGNQNGNNVTGTKQSI